MIDTVKLPRVVLVTGPSGAGRTTAIHVLEDLGFESIDNIPLSLMPRLFSGPPMEQPMALGVDTRNREFSVSGLLAMRDQLAELSGAPVELLYLDCRRDVLLRRFSETRRRHPLAPAESPKEGIERELDLLKLIRVRADILIDTSEHSPHDLRREVEKWFAPDKFQRLAISVQSFSYKRGLPQGVDMVFDCRFLRNPYWQEELRSGNGQDAAVAEYVADDPRYKTFFAQVLGMCESLLPAYADEGKAHLAIAFGCSGGQHRSVTLAENLSKALADLGWQVSIRHRELERRNSARLESLK